MLPKWDGTKHFEKMLKRLGLTYQKCRKVKKFRTGWVAFACKADMEAVRSKIRGHVVKGNRLKASVINLVYVTIMWSIFRRDWHVSGHGLYGMPTGAPTTTMTHPSP